MLMPGPTAINDNDCEETVPPKKPKSALTNRDYEQEWGASGGEPEGWKSEPKKLNF